MRVLKIAKDSAVSTRTKVITNSGRSSSASRLRCGNCRPGSARPRLSTAAPNYQPDQAMSEANKAAIYSVTETQPFHE